VAIAAIWYALVRDRPEEHPHLNTAELAIIGRNIPEFDPPQRVTKVKVPWLRLVHSAYGRWKLVSVGRIVLPRVQD
jgi:hypothetical protein